MVKCVVCGKDIAVGEGFFTDDAGNYHEKCYADKRWGEVDATTKKKWREQIRLSWFQWIKEAETDEEKKERKEFVKKFKVPKALDKEVDKL